MKIAVEDFVYWGVVALASDGNRSQGEVLQELLAEALRWRALAADRVPVPETEFEDAIAQAAGLIGIATVDMQAKIMALGWMTWVEDMAEHADGLG